MDEKRVAPRRRPFPLHPAHPLGIFRDRDRGRGDEVEAGREIREQALDRTGPFGGEGGHLATLILKGSARGAAAEASQREEQQRRGRMSRPEIAATRPSRLSSSIAKSRSGSIVRPGAPRKSVTETLSSDCRKTRKGPVTIPGAIPAGSPAGRSAPATP